MILAQGANHCTVFPAIDLVGARHASRVENFVHILTNSKFLSNKKILSTSQDA